ncbi:RING [Seminavis robusta]|uniref:RING n=1 Tax=Seminavis robusta TaxID=568900 RepID=A0A9N8DLD7_9STRA|nr:RING [Seminavis robusta]|eukprot:Sro222_g091230.1 RING (205) ;mRNA; f:68185-68799
MMPWFHLLDDLALDCPIYPGTQFQGALKYFLCMALPILLWFLWVQRLSMMADSYNAQPAPIPDPFTSKDVGPPQVLGTCTDDDEEPHCCAICLDDMEPGTKVCALPCHHYFHPQCMDKWLARDASYNNRGLILQPKPDSCCWCPMCKYDLTRHCQQHRRQAANKSSKEEHWWNQYLGLFAGAVKVSRCPPPLPSLSTLPTQVSD